MGFWNSVIYVTTSREACRSLSSVMWIPWRHQKSVPARGGEDRRILEPRRVRSPHGDSDSQEELATGANAV